MILERIVAHAAPSTPQLKVYINKVSNATLTIEPMIIAAADVFDAPCETMILDMDTFNVPMTQLMIKSPVSYTHLSTCITNLVLTNKST